MTEYALVTGASRNIGRAVAERLKADGYSILMLDRIEPEDPSLGEFRQVDLSDPDATREALDRVVGGRAVTRLVNCAGVVRMEPLEEVALDAFDALMAINVRSYIQTMQAVLPGMKSAGFGRVVNIASRAALGHRHQTVYSATKAALVGLTKTWAIELAGHGITCNAVGPGPVDTDMFRAVYPEGSEERAKYLARIPVGRVGRSGDVAHAVSYFLDARASFVTGQVLFVCGGLTLEKSNAT